MGFMYYKENADQHGIDEFFLPFGGKLKKDNRSFGVPTKTVAQKEKKSFEERVVWEHF